MFSSVTVTFVFILCFPNLSGSKTIGLYSTDDDIVILSSKNFYDTVLGTDNAWMIEFYNAWCGHCIHFAHTWKKIGKDLKGWQRVITLAAIDCSASENLKICRSYNIKGYPNFKILPPYSDKNNTGELFEEQNEDAIMKKLIDYVSNKTIRREAKNWPNLEVLGSVEKIWEAAQDEHEHVALIFEEEGSIIGKEVILDLSNYKHLLVRRVSNKHAAKFGIVHFPSLYILHKDGRYERIAKNVKDRYGFTAALLRVLGVIQVINRPTDQSVLVDKMEEMEKKPTDTLPQPNKKLNDTKLKVDTNQSSSRLYIQDLESALSYSFRQEIAIKKTITGDALKALKQFITVLAKYFPGKTEIKTYLWRLSTWLEHLTDDITGREWAEKLDSLQSQDSFLPEKITWRSCAGSHPRYRGYPCGMWMLFHSLTVGSYISSQINKKSSPVEVLTSVNGYMQNFFGCKECSKNFNKMASSIEDELTNHRDAVLWLWRAHNRANKRLHGDPSEDPKHPKIQFPSKSMCPSCYFNDEDPNDIKWNSKQVFKFLLKFYRKSGILDLPDKKDILPGEMDSIDKELDWWELKQRKTDLEKIKEILAWKRQRQRLLQTKKTIYQRSHFTDSISKDVKEETLYFKRTLSGWGFSNVDFGMCVMFYFLCTSLIVILYYHFIVRRRYKSPCKFLPL